MTIEITVVTYQAYSTTIKPEHLWIGYIVLPNGDYLGVMFRDSTNEGVAAKARKFWEVESKKQIYKTADEVVETAEPHRFAGKTWMRHIETRELLRVPAEDVESYIAKGYEKSGPRSK